MALSTIEFLLKNNVVVIQIVFALIFCLAVFVIAKSFKEEKEDTKTVAAATTSRIREALKDTDAKPTVDVKKETAKPTIDDSPLDDLDNLDDLLGAEEKAATPPPTSAAAAPSPTPADPTATATPAVTQVNAAQSEELTKALQEKEKIISDMRAEIAVLQEKAKASGDTNTLELKVKELSEKLAEYEIIEDDIANLSFYKTENAKLKTELEKLKGGGPALSVVPSEPEIKEPVAEPQLKEPAEPIVDNVMKEFEKAVEQKEALEKTVQNTPVAATAPAAAAAKTEDDLMKEFESVVEKELATNPTPPAPKTEGKADINPDKLLQEVEDLAAKPPPTAPADDGKDSNQKLIEEFENFVNKG